MNERKIFGEIFGEMDKLLDKMMFKNERYFETDNIVICVIEDNYGVEHIGHTYKADIKEEKELKENAKTNAKSELIQYMMKSMHQSKNKKQMMTI